MVILFFFQRIRVLSKINWTFPKNRNIFLAFWYIWCWSKSKKRGHQSSGNFFGFVINTLLLWRFISKNLDFVTYWFVYSARMAIFSEKVQENGHESIVKKLRKTKKREFSPMSYPGHIGVFLFAKSPSSPLGGWGG